MHSTNDLPVWDDQWVLDRRPARPEVDPWRPHGFFVEQERQRDGTIDPVATLLLAGKECPFRCVMCDLWKYTTTTRTPAGAVPAQIEYALARLPEARHAKLYNAGNFFDAQAIPTADLPRIAELMAGFASVLVECHPRLVDGRCVEFRDALASVHPFSRDPKGSACVLALPFGSRLNATLGVAMGLETIHPEVLPRLNKRMTLTDFSRAARFLVAHGIAVRAFVLVRPPLLDEAEGVEWAVRSVEWAFGEGVECCTLIPTRAGNGAMEELRSAQLFDAPSLRSLEEALARCLALGGGRVFADLWDIEALAKCTSCGPARVERLRRMNLGQMVLPRVECDCESA
jgi:archaeosine synthase beta-subunit